MRSQSCKDPGKEPLRQWKRPCCTKDTDMLLEPSRGKSCKTLGTSLEFIVRTKGSIWRVLNKAVAWSALCLNKISFSVKWLNTRHSASAKKKFAESMNEEIIPYPLNQNFPLTVSLFGSYNRMCSSKTRIKI